jgi:hypothetical protein
VSKPKLPENVPAPPIVQQRGALPVLKNAPLKKASSLMLALYFSPVIFTIRPPCVPPLK